MKELTVANLYTLEETIAKDLFEGVEYPWEVLPKISGFILELGATLPKEEYDKVGEDVWIAKSAKVFESAYIHGSSARMRKSGIALLSVEMLLSAKEPSWEILPSLRT